jgi:hypothetical protein
MIIKLRYNKIVSDRHHKMSFFNNLSWGDLIEYSYKRLGWTKKRFILEILKARDEQILKEYKLSKE